MRRTVSSSFGIVLLAVCLVLGMSDSIAAPFSACEYKLLLKTEPFADREAGCRDVWEKVKNAAADAGIYAAEGQKPFRESVRQVAYLDTGKGDLFSRQYILRMRAKDDDGKAPKKVEVTLKYRVPAGTGISESAVETSPGYRPSVKWEKDCIGFANGRIAANVLEDSLSHVVKNVPNTPRAVLRDYAAIFPVLRRLGIDDTSAVGVVNNIAVREYKISPGYLDFGSGKRGDVDISVWYDDKSDKLISVELSYTVPWTDEADTSATRFFSRFQAMYSDLLSPGRVKVQTVYE